MASATDLQTELNKKPVDTNIYWPKYLWPLRIADFRGVRAIFHSGRQAPLDLNSPIPQPQSIPIRTGCAHFLPWLRPNPHVNRCCMFVCVRACFVLLLSDFIAFFELRRTHLGPHYPELCTPLLRFRSARPRRLADAQLGRCVVRPIPNFRRNAPLPNNYILYTRFKCTANISMIQSSGLCRRCSCSAGSHRLRACVRASVLSFYCFCILEWDYVRAKLWFAQHGETHRPRTVRKKCR